MCGITEPRTWFRAGGWLSVSAGQQAKKCPGHAMKRSGFWVRFTHTKARKLQSGLQGAVMASGSR
jgi:hypothetical protein